MYECEFECVCELVWDIGTDVHVYMYIQCVHTHTSHMYLGMWAVLGTDGVMPSDEGQLKSFHLNWSLRYYTCTSHSVT